MTDPDPNPRQWPPTVRELLGLTVVPGPYDQDDEEDEEEDEPEDDAPDCEPPADRMEFPGHEGM